jgi:hypothetical protein
MVTELWSVIKSRMVNIATDPTYCRQEFHPLFTHSPSISVRYDMIEKLIHKPLLISTNELCQILELRLCTKETSPQEGVAAIYYIRTFPITVGALKSIIASWETAHRRYDPVPFWSTFIELNKLHDNQLLYVRYIGMSQSLGTTGWKRFHDDLSQRKNGILAAFTEEILRNYPTAFRATEVHEIMGASLVNLPPQPGHPALIPVKSFIDDRERIIIALFNHKYLLNQQTGGFYVAYHPMASDHILAANLRCKFFDMFAKRVDVQSVAGKKIQVEVGKWAQRVREYGIDHPVETLTNIFPMTDNDFESVLLRQALPGIIGGRCLLACFGKDITIEDYKKEVTFFSGNSRAANVTITMLANLRQNEAGFGDRINQEPFLDGQFPFINLFPHIGHEDPEDAAELAREYIAITQPRVIVTFSRLVSSWVAANFVHPYGIPRSYSSLLLMIVETFFGMLECRGSFTLTIQSG